MKKTSLLFAIAVCSIGALAHEFWFMPNRFFFSPGQTANLRFKVGENFEGDNWSGNKDRIQQLIHYTPVGGKTDISDKLSQAKGDSVQLVLQEHGTHMVIFNSNNSFISLEPSKFNEYLAEDGLNAVAAYRKQHNEENKKSTEHYQRSIKTILQVGELRSNQCTQPTTLPLDIIPENNPYHRPSGNSDVQASRERFKVLFKGRPAGNVLVRCWSKLDHNTRTFTDTARTDSKGMVSFPKTNGYTMISCVYMEHTPNDKEAEWQSYWASVSFQSVIYYQ